MREDHNPPPSVAQPECVSLVQRARAGDPAAWSALFTQYDQKLRRIARSYRLDPHDAADVTQTVWVRCLERIGQLRDDTNFSGWLSVICRREALAVLASSKRVDLIDPLTDTRVDIPSDDADITALEVIDALDREALRAAWEDLPERQALVVRALARSTFTDYAAMARDLGIPIGSIGPTRARAISRLRTDPRLCAAS